jgi:hypothetical protein
MSIEQKISELTAAVTALTAALVQRAGVSNVPQTQVSVNPAPVAAPQQTGAVMGGTPWGNMPAAQQQMPALPTFAAAPTPAAPVQGAPFTDGQGLIAYVMGAYKEMGATKGAGIQGVLTQLGYQNINDVKPEHYGALYQGVEALKRG